MRRRLSLFLACLMLCMTACGVPAKQPASTQPATQAKSKGLSFDTQHIRTEGYQGELAFPGVQQISSKTELDKYYENNRSIFDLERKETNTGFLNVCDRYDAAFFETKFLLLILLQEGSGSITHQVTAVAQTPEGKLEVSVASNVPEVGTSDMAHWHIFVELEREAVPEKPEDIFLYLDGTLRWNGSAIAPQRELPLDRPPDLNLRTPQGEVTVTPAGYHWQKAGVDGVVIADHLRPTPETSTVTAFISSEYAEDIYGTDSPHSSTLKPTGEKGYFIKMYFAVAPVSVDIVCWKDTIWQDSTTPEETLNTYSNSAFYAKTGVYLYEINATWNDPETYTGTASYYLCVNDTGLHAPEYHTYHSAQEPHLLPELTQGYCGNTMTTIHDQGKTYSFMGGNSVTLTDLLLRLNYDPLQVCRCAPEYTVDTEFGTGYGINLTQGYVRCEKGQVSLTQEQIAQIRTIIQWAKTADQSQKTTA